jgi:hypothetical protein
MTSRNRTRRFDRNKFEAHLIRENADGSGQSIRFLQSEDEELDKLAEDEFRANYQQEYEKACAQAEEEWYPYRVAGVLEGQLIEMYEHSEIDSIIKKRWSDLRNQTRERYVNAMGGEVNKALERRAMLQTYYETDCGFRVKSKGEQAVANTLRLYTVNRSTGHSRISLLYEPLFRIPEENRVIIPDFVVPEYCLIIEFAGLEERNYKFGLFMKMEAIRKLGFPIIIIRPEDLNDLRGSLERKLRFYFDLAAP